MGAQQNLWDIANELDAFIESMVWSGQSRGKDIKTIQGILKKVDLEIERMNVNPYLLS